VRTATLWYKPADKPATQEQIDTAFGLMSAVLGRTITGHQHSYAEHPGEPASTWTIPTEHGFTTLVLDQDVEEDKQFACEDPANPPGISCELIVVVERAPSNIPGIQEDEV
jgi:hypothetical protein